MLCKSVHGFVLLAIATFSLSAVAESYRFDSHLGDARQVTVTPPAAGTGSRSLFSPEGALAWRASGTSPDSRISTEGNALVFTTNGPDGVHSPDLDLDMSEVGCLELELRVEGQDKVRVTRCSFLNRKSCDISVPQQGQAFTARIDPRGQEGWLYPAAKQLMISVEGAARLEIHAVRAVPSMLTAPVGTGMHRTGATSRQTLYANCPAVLEYALHVPPNGFFTAGLGVSSNAQPVTFQADVRCGDRVTALLARTVDAAGSWTDVEADLSAFAGQDVTVTLSASCDTPGQVALWSNPAVLERRAPGACSRPNVVFYVVDALRADHLDAYGYPRKTAPEITAFAEGGVRFEWCLSQATWTQPSTSSFHTSVEPAVHKVLGSINVSIPPSLATFPELLRDSGYTTGAVTDNWLSPPRTAPRCSYGILMDNRAATDGTTERAVRFLEANRDRPFFLYFHTMEPHARYGEAFYETDPARRAPLESWETASEESESSDLDDYDKCVVQAGRNFGHFLRRLAALGLAENTLVVISADHGEAFMEHGIMLHSGAPYIELIHVPLALSWPGVLPAGKVLSEVVSLLDVAPTILDYAGIPAPAQFQGRSLRGLVEGGDAAPFTERTVFSHGIASSFYPFYDVILSRYFLEPMVNIDPDIFHYVYTRYFDDVYSAVSFPWALWRKFPDGPAHLYNLAVDPGQTEDVAAQHPETAKDMSDRIDGHLRRQAELSVTLGTADADRRTTFDSEQRDALKALGYVAP